MYNEEKILGLVEENLNQLVDEYGMNCLHEAEEVSAGRYVNRSYDIDLSMLQGYKEAADMPKFITIPLPETAHEWYDPIDWIYDDLTSGDVDPDLLTDGYKVKDDYDGLDDNDFQELCKHVDWQKVKKDILNSSDRRELEENFMNAVKQAIYD